MSRFIYPLDDFTLTQGFGADPAYYAQFGQQGHNGLDLAAATGTPVKAACAGTIDFEGWGQNSSWMGSVAGISVIINHGDVRTGYAHLDSTVVNKGDQVAQGQVIGYVGSTGTATGPHNHFEFIGNNFNNGYAGRINPSNYDLGKKGAQASGGSLMTENFIKETYRGFVGVEPSQAEVDFHMANSNPESFVNGFNGNYKWRTLDTQVKALASQLSTLQAQMITLRADFTASQSQVATKNASIATLNTAIADKDKQIEQLKLAQGTGSGIDAETKATITETNVIVKWLQNVISAVFNRSK